MNPWSRRAVVPLAWAACLLAACSPAIARLQESRADDRATEPARGELASLRVVAADPEDAGRVHVGSTVRRRVEFTNVLDVPVDLAVSTKTCGCLDARFGAETVGPGARVELVLTVPVAPGAGEQAHSVTFTAGWSGGGARRTEQGVCLVRFTPDIQYVIHPSRVALGVIRGDSIRFEVVVRWTRPSAPAPELDEGRCSLPGWSIEAVDAPDDTVRRYVVRGAAAEVGLFDAELSWDSPDGSTLRVPVRLRVLDPWRSRNGGVVIGKLDEGSTVRTTVELVPRRAGGPAPASVQLDPEVPGVSARLASAHGLDVQVRRGPNMPSVGACAAVIKDKDGNRLGVVPVVWWLDR